jgi:hypothetical protein
MPASNAKTAPNNQPKNLRTRLISDLLYYNWSRLYDIGSSLRNRDFLFIFFDGFDQAAQLLGNQAN